MESESEQSFNGSLRVKFPSDVLQGDFTPHAPKPIKDLAILFIQRLSFHVQYSWTSLEHVNII